MTEPTLFRKVFCKDKLPDKGGEYHTNKGKDIFILISEEWEWDKYFVKASEWWLEPVQEPTEEEIESAVNELAKESTAPDKDTPDWMKADIRRGFKKALELLKGK